MGNNILIIRGLRHSDLKMVKEIRDYCLEYLDTQISYSYEDTCKWFEEQNPKWYVLEMRDKIMGYIRTSNYDEVNKSFYVGLDLHPNFQGCGYAFQSYQKFLDTMKIKGYFISYLKVQISNYRAYNLYRKLGFNPIGVIPNAVIKGDKRVDSVIMYKTL